MQPVLIQILAWLVAYALALAFSGVVVKRLFQLADIRSNEGLDRAGRVSLLAASPAIQM